MSPRGYNTLSITLFLCIWVVLGGGKSFNCPSQNFADIIRFRSGDLACQSIKRISFHSRNSSNRWILSGHKLPYIKTTMSANWIPEMRCCKNICLYLTLFTWPSWTIRRGMYPSNTVVAYTTKFPAHIDLFLYWREVPDLLFFPNESKLRINPLNEMWAIRK